MYRASIGGRVNETSYSHVLAVVVSVMDARPELWNQWKLCHLETVCVGTTDDLNNSSDYNCCFDCHTFGVNRCTCDAAQD